VICALLILHPGGFNRSSETHRRGERKKKGELSSQMTTSDITFLNRCPDLDNVSHSTPRGFRVAENPT
jgi:hypothetical protein